MSEMYVQLRQWVENFPDEVTIGVSVDAEACLVRNFLGCESVSRLGYKRWDSPHTRVPLPCDVQIIVSEFDKLSHGVKGSEVEVLAYYAKQLFAVG